MQVFLFLLITIPKIEVISDSFDFGEITWENVNHVFFVINKGDDTLKIKKVSSSCGCTKVKIEKKTLLPGDTTELTVIFSPGGHKLTGDIVRKISIHSNDPQNPVKILTITAKVFPPETYSSRKKYKNLPDFVFNSQNTLKAYLAVKEDPEFYEAFPCYCGCDDVHKNLKECYILENRIIDHASDCDICIDEVIDIIKLKKLKAEKEKMLDFIRKKYSDSEN